MESDAQKKHTVTLFYKGFYINFAIRTLEHVLYIIITVTKKQTCIHLHCLFTYLLMLQATYQSLLMTYEALLQHASFSLVAV